MKHLVFCLSLVLAFGASAITATKEYVDRATNATRSAVSAYADRVGASALESASAYADDATNELDRALSAKIQAATPSDYETVKSNATAGSVHASRSGNPHGVTAQQAFSAGPSVSGDAYFNGSTYFGDTGSAFFDSVPTFRGEFDESTLRTAGGGTGFMVMTPASARMAATGIVHTPEASSSAHLYDVFLKFPHKSGVFALLSDVPTVPDWALAANPPASMPDNGLVLTNGSVKTKSGTAIAASDVGAFPAASGQTLQQAVQVISVHLNAEDARDIVTNYNSAVNMPSRRLEYKEPDGPNAGTWRVVWDELTRWNWLTGTYLPSNFYTRAEVDARTDHVQWGLFDSQTGNFSPDKTVQISSDRVILCRGASYQRTATASGTYFVWTSNEPYSITGVESNGCFRIEDADGNTTFEIVKGDKVTAAATAGGVSTENVLGITHLHIRYPIEAETHPTLEICNDLATHDWKAETDPSCKANVTWTGVSGNYTAEVWGKSAESALFVKATYERGSDPYVRYAQAIALQTVKIGNTIYYVGTATISGHTVLTLSLTPQ